MLEVDEVSVCLEGDGDGDGDPQSELGFRRQKFCKNEAEGVVDCETDGAKVKEEQG